MDPLSRQLAEAVRIERRGLEILNSKSEFSRCRVPRLVINLEEWRSKSKEKDAVVKKSIDAEVVSESDADDEALIKALEDTEKIIRRKEGKRKEEGEGKGRKSNRRKLERKFSGWPRGWQLCRGWPWG